MDRNRQNFSYALLAAVLAVGGCSGANTVPSNDTASVMTAFPSRAAYGVVAHYRVYLTHVENAPAQLVALQVQTPQSYLWALRAVAVPYAAVRYPDGSVQRTAADGTFDAAAGTYARSRQHATADVSVILSAPSSGAPIAAGAHIFAPSAAEEARTASGAIADDVSTRLRPAAYAFTCDPTHYMRPSVIDVAAGKDWTSPNFKAQADISYYPLFGFCGVNDSFLPSSWVTAVRHWSDTTEQVTVTDGAILGCHQPPNRPRARPATSTFTCTVRTWYTNATFYTSKPWSSNNDVALWFEAWHFNAFRDHSSDAHLALLRVR